MAHLGVWQLVRQADEWTVPKIVCKVEVFINKNNIFHSLASTLICLNKFSDAMPG